MVQTLFAFRVENCPRDPFSLFLLSICFQKLPFLVPTQQHSALNARPAALLVLNQSCGTNEATSSPREAMKRRGEFFKHSRMDFGWNTAEILNSELLFLECTSYSGSLFTAAL